ncbi:polypeptide N-acetylgalactosaminyltransferase 15 isoform X6 [Castor canadensis]|uniref:Polypeptide N-acetylgalactosaminyltransferase 15 isoform X6 n=1 Tax=Castor canadensis TaxID=51338 RepID=A0AC58K537_CASCN
MASCNNMLPRKRLRHGLCRLQFLLLFLMLGCVLLMVALLLSPPPTLHQAVTGQATKPSPESGYRLDFGDSQEWILEDEDEGEEYRFLEGLPPFISLREDQLLVAVASPRAKRNQSQSRRRSGYRLIKQPSRRQDEEASERDWGAKEEDGEVSEEEEPTLLSLDSHGLSEVFSASLPLRRALPEVRHPLCLQQQPEDSLPTASVILCFHDEAWSTLLRTVHSILDTAPRALLKELILVDDFSQQGQLKSALSEYVARLEGVKLLRNSNRLGAIRARMLGAARATGDVLVFMDAHCECHPGWLEPLLSRIAGDRSRVVSPVIDVIDWKTSQYHPAKEPQRGVLDWKLEFHWEPLPEREKKVRQSSISPIRSPVAPGEVVAMDRHYFQNTGAYDPLMSLQGGENLELSFKDTRAPLDQEATLQNKVRIAETWLGSFKETFYRHSPEAFALRKHLELTSRKEIHFGSSQHLCFDVQREQVILQNCTEQGPAIHQQLWDFQDNGVIVHILSGKCLEAVVQQDSKDLYLCPCDGKASQLWRFDQVHTVDER